MLILRKESIKFLELDNKEYTSILIILLFATMVAINILDDKNLFMANGVRTYSRIQYGIKGLNDYGRLPIYNPEIAHGEATYLFNTPSFHSHISLTSFMLGNAKPILLFNSYPFFILLLSTISLFILFQSIVNKEESSLNMLVVIAVTITIGLNFYFLQMLESFKLSYTLPISHLLLSIILNNPKTFKEFVILMYC